MRRLGIGLALLFVAGTASATEDDRLDARLVAERKATGDVALFFRGATTRTAASSLTLATDARAILTAVGHRFGPAIAVEGEMGPARPLGFVHRLHVHPLGLGLALGTHGSIVLSAGAGFGGQTGRLPFDLELPIAARLAVDLSDRARLLVDARAFWTPDARGGNAATVGDETRLGLGARIGRTWRSHGMLDAGGYFFRLERTERLGTTVLGLAIGYELGGTLAD